MKDLFKPEDFDSDGLITCEDRSISIADAIRLANKKINKLIESWPVVYGKNWLMENVTRWVEADIPFPMATHQGRIAFIKELPKEGPCEHEIDFHITGFSSKTKIEFFKKDWEDFISPTRKCKHCGIELVAKWEAKKT